MPEGAVDEDAESRPAERHVGPPRQPEVESPAADPRSEERPPEEELRRRVPRSDARHQRAALFRRQLVGHVREGYRSARSRRRRSWNAAVSTR